MSSYTFPRQLAVFHLMTHHRHPSRLSLGLDVQIKSFFFIAAKRATIFPSGGHLECFQALATRNSRHKHLHMRTITEWGFVSVGRIYKVG